MKRLLLPTLILCLSILACSLPVTPGGTEVSVPPTATSEVAPPTDVPTDVPVTGPVANVTCNQVSFYLDPALASGYTCETVPETSGADIPAFAVNPEFTRITLTGYVISGNYLGTRIELYPVQRFIEIEPEVVPVRLVELQALLAGGAPSADHLPILPIFNAGQLFHSGYEVLPFASGNGIRFLTMYGQDYGPANNQNMVYTYQGLTNDGQYWVAVILPATNPILPPDGSTLPGDQTWEEFYANYETYRTDIENQLNAQPPASFAPGLTLLDQLVASITVAP